MNKIPVTSCECDSSVSVLRRLNTYLRSTMCRDRPAMAWSLVCFWAWFDEPLPH